MMDQARTDRLVNLCRRFIRARSLSGQEKEMAALVTEAMKQGGYDEVQTDRFGNVVGKMTFGKGGPRILFEGHMDHVDVGDPSKWTKDPYGAEISDGKIWGRATSDMKGALAAMILAPVFLREDGARFDGEVYVAGSVHEECFEGVASELVAQASRPDYVVIGEASSLNVKRGQRGRAEIVMETYGKPAHSSNPKVGLNAVKKMMPLLMAVEKEFNPHTDPVLGEGILEVTDIISTPWPGASVVPEKCGVTFDRRLLVGETHDKVLDQINRIIEGQEKFDPELKASAFFATGEEKCYTGEPIKAERFAPGWLFSEKEPFIQSAVRALQGVGMEPELSHYYFCTNGSYYAGKAGIPTIGFGPSLEELAHVVDEYIEIEQLAAACEGYAAIAAGMPAGKEA